jgi:MoxR-like ATPase
MRITVGYPPAEHELRILETKAYVPQEIKEKPVCTGSRVLEMQRAVTEVRVDRSLAQYILAIIQKTRQSRDLELGASPRGSLALYRAAQSRAFVRGELFVTPDDVKALTVPVLAHRVAVSGRRASAPTSQDARSSAEMILKEILETVEVPM